MDDGATVHAAGAISPPRRDSIAVGRLGLGWYRVEFTDTRDEVVAWTTAAVLAKRHGPPPIDSPIAVDGAVSWFARSDPKRQEDFARLAALASGGWIRDRMNWEELQRTPGSITAGKTSYDTAATLQARHGLRVLQVFHRTPSWAVFERDGTGRFPDDLRHVYRFCRAMAERYRGRVQAWEPWNEANIRDFGGHTADAMGSFQKAAFLGFRAADSDITVCWNVHAGIHTRPHARTIIDNESWPYFDTYNIHSYDWPESYAELWATAREAACGRPIWVTECDRGLQYATDGPWHDLTREGELRKAEFMAHSYVSSLLAGSSRHFHFILGHYTEDRNRVQFGLLRHDMTPRPAYVALAALGRFLDSARCLGRVRQEDSPRTWLVAFRAVVDAEPCDVLVAWAQGRGEWSTRGAASEDWSLPPNIRVRSVHDYLGRPIERLPRKLTPAAVFAILPPGDADRLPLESPAVATAKREGKPSPIVLQLRMPPDARREIGQRKWAQEFEYVVPLDRPVTLDVRVYNFATSVARGRVAVERVPEGWRLDPAELPVEIAPLGRQDLTVRVVRPTTEGTRSSDTRVKLRGEFAEHGRPALAFRLLSFAGEGYDREK